MTTLLPSKDLAFFRSIAKTAAVLLICLHIDSLYPGRAIADFEIADILEQDPRTINKHLRSLSAAGLVLEQREFRYVVTPLGRNTLFGNRETSIFSIEETKNTSDEPFPCTQIVPHELNDELTTNIVIESSSVIESTKCAQLLEATHLLFETPVNASGIIERDATHVLAWIAKAYADRKKLTNPQGLVYKRILENTRPPVYLLKNPTQGLPDNYLEAVGLLEKICPRCSEKFTTLFEYDEHFHKCLWQPVVELDDEPVITIRVDASVEQRLDDGQTMSPAMAWQSVLDQLQIEMQRPTFDSWVRDSQAVHYQDDVLQVGVENNNIRDWLDNRLTSTVERLLVGILNREVTVQFVVAVETEVA